MGIDAETQQPAQRAVAVPAQLPRARDRSPEGRRREDDRRRHRDLRSRASCRRSRAPSRARPSRRTTARCSSRRPQRATSCSRRPRSAEAVDPVRRARRRRPSMLKQLGARAGYTGVVDDPDGGARRYLYGFNGLKSFAVAVVERETGKPVPRSIFTEDGDSRGSTSTGRPGTIPEVPYWKVYEGKTPPGYFRGKTVVVGATDPVLKDVFHTSTSGDQLMSGPELQAHAIGTVRRGNPLRERERRRGRAADRAARAGRAAREHAAAAVGHCSSRSSRPARSSSGAQLAFDGGTIVTFVYPLLALIVGIVRVAGRPVLHRDPRAAAHQAAVLALRAGERGRPGARPGRRRPAARRRPARGHGDVQRPARLHLVRGVAAGRRA